LNTFSKAETNKPT